VIANALVMIALLALVTTTILSAGLAMTRVAVYQGAQRVIAAGYEGAVSSIAGELSQEISSGKLVPTALPSPLPELVPGSPAPACASAPCAYSTSYSAVLTTTRGITAGATPAPCGDADTNCATDLQENADVGEGRVTARISMNVSGADGTPILTRAEDVTFRLTDVPPYVTVVGTRDGTIDELAATATQGDAGGLASGSASCAAQSSDDTSVHVQYYNTATQSCSDGSSWQTQGYSSAANDAPGWSR
jgi:hypothetical protein